MGLSSLFGYKDANAPPATPVENSISDNFKNQISQELAIVSATELVNKATENCFQQCLKQPYTDKNKPCVDQCLSKYLQSWNTISKAYLSRIQDASASGEI